MVVMSHVHVEPPNPEETLNVLQGRTATRSLRHHESMHDLPAGSVAPSPAPIALANEADGEAALSIHKTDHPAELNQPFLLVSCTGHIVTVPPTWDGTRSAGYTRRSSI